MVDQTIHKIIISGPVINYKAEIDGPTAAQVYQGLEKLVQDVSSSSNSEVANNLSSGSSMVLGRTMSGREFLDSVNAKTNPEKILAFTKYLYDKGVLSVGPIELRTEFQNAREPMPSNLGRDLTVAVRNGWITPAAGASKYYITDRGEKALDAKFAGEREANIKTRSFRKINKNTFIKTEIREEVKSLKLDRNLEGYPNLLDLSSSSDRILWILIKAKFAGVAKLNQKEISYVSENLGTPILRKSISALVIGHYHKKNIVSPIENSVKYLEITELGENYLKSLISRQVG